MQSVALDEENVLLTTSGLMSLVGPQIIQRVKQVYLEDSRYYHTWDHVMAVLRSVLTLDLGTSLARIQAHALAALFHDVIYVPYGTNNEKNSKEFMLALCHGGPADVLEHAADLIMATSRHATATTSNTPPSHRDFMDCDILSIAQPYWALAVQTDWCEAAERVLVRPVDEVMAGRQAFLKSWLAKPSVFLGKTIGQQHEWQARQNIARLIDIKHDFTTHLEKHGVKPSGL